MEHVEGAALAELALVWLGSDQRARLIIGAGLSIRWINAAAAKLFDDCPDVYVQGGKLHFARHADETRFRSVASAATETPTTLALPGCEQGQHLLFRCWRDASVVGDAVCVDVIADRPVEAADTRSLTAMFGLTAGEVRIAQALLEGMTVGEIARDRGLSIDTVRTHVRGIYAKTGSTSREHFFRRMMPFYLL